MHPITSTVQSPQLAPSVSSYSPTPSLTHAFRHICLPENCGAFGTVDQRPSDKSGVEQGAPPRPLLQAVLDEFVVQLTGAERGDGELRRCRVVPIREEVNRQCECDGVCRDPKETERRTAEWLW